MSTTARQMAEILDVGIEKSFYVGILLLMMFIFVESVQNSGLFLVAAAITLTTIWTAMSINSRNT